MCLVWVGQFSFSPGCVLHSLGETLPRCTPCWRLLVPVAKSFHTPGCVTELSVFAEPSCELGSAWGAFSFFFQQSSPFSMIFEEYQCLRGGLWRTALSCVLLRGYGKHSSLPRIGHLGERRCLLVSLREMSSSEKGSPRTGVWRLLRSPRRS